MDAARTPGPEALKALAHPLRLRLYTDLASFGPATASALAARLGESSGSTSYHLRQLERHGFVREDEERGNGRDRWWERVPGVVSFADPVLVEAGADREVSGIIDFELRRLQEARYDRYLTARPSLEVEWVAAAQQNTAFLQLSPAELAELADEVEAVVDRYRGRDETDERQRVEIGFRAFPLVPGGGDPAP